MKVKVNYGCHSWKEVGEGVAKALENTNKDYVIDKQFKLIKALEKTRDIQLKKIKVLKKKVIDLQIKKDQLAVRLDEAEEQLMTERDIGYEDGHESCWVWITYAFDIFEEMSDDEATKLLDDILPDDYDGSFGPYLKTFCEKCHEWKAEQYNRVHIGDEIIHGGQRHIIMEERADGDVLAWNLDQKVEIAYIPKHCFETGVAYKTGKHYDSIPLEKE